MYHTVYALLWLDCGSETWLWSLNLRIGEKQSISHVGFNLKSTSSPVKTEIMNKAILKIMEVDEATGIMMKYSTDADWNVDM